MAKRLGKVRVRKPSKNIFMFVLSLVLGGVGVFYSKQYIETQVAHYKSQLEKTETMIEVVVPKRSLRRGEIVRQGDLLTRPIPEQFYDTNSVTAATFEVAIGQRVDFDIDQGRPLLWAHLEGGQTPTFSGKVPTGLRAMTIRVDEINSISGFLQPKDKIDLLLTYGETSQKQIFPLIQNLNVIATGVQTFVNKKGGAEANRAFTTITIQVTPDQAQKITLSQSLGKITAMLRNPDDESPLSDKPMTIAQVLNLPKPKPPKKVVKKKVKKVKPGIEYIIGGS